MPKRAQEANNRNCETVEKLSNHLHSQFFFGKKDVLNFNQFPCISVTSCSHEQTEKTIPVRAHLHKKNRSILDEIGIKSHSFDE